MTHLELLRRQWPDHNTSPAQALDFVVGSDNDGWPVYLSLRVGDIVTTAAGSMYRVAGFTRNNTVLCRPHGLGHDPAVIGTEFRPSSLSVPHNDASVTHCCGLVVFS